MQRENFVSDFSKRLNSALRQEGYASHRSQAGVAITELAKIAGVSYQMARKYSLGLALPDYHIIPKIAKWLNISPSWLLFGEKELLAPAYLATIEIDHELLKYILQKSSLLFSIENDVEKVVSYIASVIYDASHINADRQTIIKIIDMMLASAIRLTDLKTERA